MAAVLCLAAGVLLALLLAGGHKPRPRTTSGTRPVLPPPTATAVSVPPGPPAQAAPPGVQIGANVNRLFQDPAFSAAQIDAQLGALRATGAVLARADALWEAVQPQPPQGADRRYDWSFDDRIAGALAAHGLRWLPLIDYSPEWAHSIPGQDKSAPSRPADYAAYAAAVAARYGPGGSFWAAHPRLPALPAQALEIWNEPDNPAFWMPAPNAGQYADLYAEARAAVTAVQPSLRVVVGGLTHPESFLPAMLAARPDLVGHIDGVAIHPYGVPSVVVFRIGRARALLDRLGLKGVPLYVTEFGWTTSPYATRDYASPAVRPGYIALTVGALGHLACGLAAATLYTWVTEDQNPRDNAEWYGISPPSGGSSRDTRAFSAGLAAAMARRPAQPCPAS